jgi:hypothetical protein
MVVYHKINKHFGNRLTLEKEKDMGVSLLSNRGA